MIKKNQKQHLLFQLNNKTQMLNIDSIISFMMFSLFLIMIINFIQNLINPYESAINYEINYKDSESLKTSFITQELNKEYLKNICNSNYSQVIQTYAYYEINSIEMPGYDSEINESIDGIQLMRNNNDLKIFFNTNQTINFEIIIPSKEEILIDKTQLDEYDQINSSRDIDYFTINLIINNTNQDNDELSMELNEETLLFINSNYNNSLIYIDKEPFFYDCNKEMKYASKKTHNEFFSLLNNKKIIAKYGVDLYWE